jgi:hypothetical protein
MTSLFLEQASRPDASNSCTRAQPAVQKVTGGGLAAPLWTQKFLWFLVLSGVAAALALRAGTDVALQNAAGGKPHSR